MLVTGAGGLRGILGVEELPLSGAVDNFTFFDCGFVDNMFFDSSVLSYKDCIAGAGRDRNKIGADGGGSYTGNVTGAGSGSGSIKDAVKHTAGSNDLEGAPRHGGGTYNNSGAWYDISGGYSKVP